MHVINSHIGSYNQGRKDGESEILVFILMNKFDFTKETLHCSKSPLSCRVYNSCPLFIFQHLLLWRSALDILCWFLEHLQPIRDFLSIRGWMSVILPKIFASSVTCTVYIAPIRCIRRRCGGLKRSRHHFLPSKAVSWQWGSCDASYLWPLCNKLEAGGRSDFYNLEFSSLQQFSKYLNACIKYFVKIRDHFCVTNWAKTDRFDYQFSSVAQSCLTPHYPIDCSTPGFLVHHQLPELTQTHVHRVRFDYKFT